MIIGNRGVIIINELEMTNSLKRLKFQKGGYSAALIVYQVLGLFTGTVPFTWMTILGFAALAGIIYLIARPTPKEK